MGNIQGAREPACPDEQWVPSLAVQTRAQALTTPRLTVLTTPNIPDSNITPEQISKAQETDPTFRKVRELCNAGGVRVKASFFKKNGLLYRKFTCPKVEHGGVFLQ